MKEFVNSDRNFIHRYLETSLFPTESFGLGLMSTKSTISSASIMTKRMMVLDDRVEEGNTVCLLYHYEIQKHETGESVDIPDSTRLSFYSMRGEGLIQLIFDVMEPPVQKPGDTKINLLNNTNKFIGTFGGILSDDNESRSHNAAETISNGDKIRSTKVNNAVEFYF